LPKDTTQQLQQLKNAFERKTFFLHRLFLLYPPVALTPFLFLCIASLLSSSYHAFKVLLMPFLSDIFKIGRERKVNTTNACFLSIWWLKCEMAIEKVLDI
jgi:hypothetical protein